MKADNTDFPEKPACRYLSLFIPKILVLNEDIELFGWVLLIQAVFRAETNTKLYISSDSHVLG